MDPEDLAYLDAEARAAADFEKHEREVMNAPNPQSPPPRRGPYLVVDNRPHVSTIEKPWPGAYIEALRYVAKDAVPDERKAALAALKLRIIEGSHARNHELLPGKVDQIANALIASASVEGFKRGVPNVDE